MILKDDLSLILGMGIALAPIIILSLTSYEIVYVDSIAIHLLFLMGISGSLFIGSMVLINKILSVDKKMQQESEKPRMWENW